MSVRAYIPPLISFALFLSGCRCGANDRPAPSFDEVYKDVLPWIEDQRPILVSPDGTQYLVKVDLPGWESELRLFDSRTKELIRAHRGGPAFLISWRPDGRVITFVSSRDANTGERTGLRLFFWSPVERRIDHAPSVPAGRSADRFMSWSPSGDRLLLFVEPKDPGGPQHLRIVEATPPYDSLPLLKILKPSDFKWSPDGRRVAIATGEGVVIVKTTSPSEQVVIPTPSPPKRIT
jgi:Tol biopolymer transport system component